MWETLYEDQFQKLAAYGARLSGSEAAGEDLAQETFLRAMLNAAVLAELPPEKQRGWLYRTLKNLFFDRYRRDALERKYALRLRPEGAEDPGIQEVENDLLLQTVDPRDQTIFHLRYFEGFTAREIAEALDLPPGTVRSRLSRCRKHLKTQLE